MFWSKDKLYQEDYFPPELVSDCLCLENVFLRYKKENAITICRNSVHSILNIFSEEPKKVNKQLLIWCLPSMALSITYTIQNDDDTLFSDALKAYTYLFQNVANFKKLKEKPLFYELFVLNLSLIFKNPQSENYIQDLTKVLNAFTHQKYCTQICKKLLVYLYLGGAIDSKSQSNIKILSSSAIDIILTHLVFESEEFDKIFEKLYSQAEFINAMIAAFTDVFHRKIEKGNNEAEKEKLNSQIEFLKKRISDHFSVYDKYRAFISACTTLINGVKENLQKCTTVYPQINLKGFRNSYYNWFDINCAAIYEPKILFEIIKTGSENEELISNSLTVIQNILVRPRGEEDKTYWTILFDAQSLIMQRPAFVMEIGHLLIDFLERITRQDHEVTTIEIEGVFPPLSTYLANCNNDSILLPTLDKLNALVKRYKTNMMESLHVHASYILTQLLCGDTKYFWEHIYECEENDIYKKNEDMLLLYAAIIPFLDERFGEGAKTSSKYWMHASKLLIKKDNPQKVENYKRLMLAFCALAIRTDHFSEQRSESSCLSNFTQSYSQDILVNVTHRAASLAASTGHFTNSVISETPNSFFIENDRIISVSDKELSIIHGMGKTVFNVTRVDDTYAGSEDELILEDVQDEDSQVNTLTSIQQVVAISHHMTRKDEIPKSIPFKQHAKKPAPIEFLIATGILDRVNMDTVGFSHNINIDDIERESKCPQFPIDIARIDAVTKRLTTVQEHEFINALGDLDFKPLFRLTVVSREEYSRFLIIINETGRPLIQSGLPISKLGIVIEVVPHGHFYYLNLLQSTGFILPFLHRSHCLLVEESAIPKIVAILAFIFFAFPQNGIGGPDAFFERFWSREAIINSIFEASSQNGFEM